MAWGCPVIQDLGNHVFDNAYAEARPAEPGDWVLSYQGRDCLLAEPEGEIAFARAGRDVPLEGLTYLFRVDEERFYLPEHPLAVPAGHGGLGYVPIDRLRLAAPRYRAFAGLTGFSLARWYEGSRFCGRCGHPTKPAPRSREKVCPACGNVIYPRIQPAVICGVTWGDRILLTKYAGRRYKNFALVAGFNEVGETLEETCHREVMEEVGVRIRNLRYYKDQPWPLTDTILAGFYAELDGDPDLVVDHHELKLGEWVRREDLPRDIADTSSLTNEMIVHFRDEWDGN